MFSSVRLALLSLRKDWQMTCIAVLLLSALGYIYASATDSLVSTESNQDSPYMWAKALTYDPFDISILEAMDTQYETSAFSFYLSNSLSDINHVPVVLVFGYQNIPNSETIDIRQWTAFASSDTCNMHPIITYEEDYQCQSIDLES